jgi:hypothetical protein
VEPDELTRPASLARNLARDLEIAADGESVLVVAGFGAGTPGITVVSV